MLNKNFSLNIRSLPICNKLPGCTIKCVSKSSTKERDSRLAAESFVTANLLTNLLRAQPDPNPLKIAATFN